MQFLSYYRNDQDMDIFTGLLCIAIAMASAIVIYYILVSSMQEKSYDEIKAEHKKNAEKYFAQDKSSQKKVKNKKNKKNYKKLKREGHSDYYEAISEEDKGHVEISETTTPVEPFPDMRDTKDGDFMKSTQPINQNQSNRKAKKVQTNFSKEFKSEKYLNKNLTENSRELDNSTYTTEKNETPIKLQVKKSKQSETEATYITTVQVQSSSFLKVAENTTNHLKSFRKKHDDISSWQDNEQEANINIIMSLVLKTELSRPETQVLVDLLLNKQGTSINSTEWIEGRLDPVLKLKKRLADKEKTLGEEQEATIALQSKLRELRSELNSEKQSSRQLEETLRQKQADLVALSSRLQLLAEDKQSLQQHIQQVQGKLTEEHRLACQLREDQDQTHKVMQQELLAQRQQLEMHIARLTEQNQETIATLEAQVRQMATQLQEQEVVKGNLNTELSLEIERKMKLQESAVQSQELSVQVKELHSEVDRLRTTSKHDYNRLQSEVLTLTEQLNSKRIEVDRLNSMVKDLRNKSNCSNHQVLSADCTDTKQLGSMLETRPTQVSSMERPATEGRENGEIYEIHTNKACEKYVLVEKFKDDILLRENDITCLKSDSKQKEALISSLTNEINAAQINIDKLMQEISSYKCLLQEQESIINALRENGDSSHNMIKSLREDVSKHMAEITRLSKDYVRRDQLESKEHIIETLISELNTHKTKLADQGLFIFSLQDELNKCRTRVESNANVGKEMNDRLAEKESVIHTLQLQSSHYQEEVKQLSSELITCKENKAKLSQELKDLNAYKCSLVHDLEMQRQKNDELRTKNWKAMDALKSVECLLETKSQHAYSLISVVEEEIRLDEQKKMKLHIQKLFPDICLINMQEYEVWLHYLKQCIENKSNTSTLKKQNSELQSMLSHYKTIIADTEGMLYQLQTRVEEKEKRWALHLHDLEAQLQTLHQGGSDIN